MSFRLDRLVTLGLVHPLRSIFANWSGVPILMYHSISNDPESDAHPYFRTCTSPQRFAEQIKFLRDQGYRTSPLSAITDESKKPEAVTEKRVVITFDDGFRDFYQHAFPVLSEYGFNASVFLPTAFIGSTPLWFKGRECLTWSEIKELSGKGIQFGSHTVTHPQLRELDAASIRNEIADSKKTIEDKLGCAADSFAYPYAFPQTDGDFRKMLRDILNTAGYRTGVCTMVGRANGASDPLFMERLPINSCDDLPLLKAKLDGAYDWVGKLQSIAKLGKTYLSRAKGPNYRVSNDFRAVH